MPFADGGEVVGLGHEGGKRFGGFFRRSRSRRSDGRRGVLGREIGLRRRGGHRRRGRLAARQLGGDAGNDRGGIHVALGPGLLQILDHGPQKIRGGQDHVHDLGIDGQIALAQFVQDVLGLVGQAVDGV